MISEYMNVINMSKTQKDECKIYRENVYVEYSLSHPSHNKNTPLLLQN